MQISIDRSLLRISQFSELKVAESSVLFGKRVSAEVRELLAEVTANLNKWSRQLQYTLDPTTVVPVNTCTEDKNTDKNKDSDRDDIEMNIVDKHPISQVNSQHIESRLDHSRGLEKMHKSALLLAENCLNFNNTMWHGWTDTIISHKESDAQSEAHIHHLFDVLTTFNALFYASNHLAAATMDLGNVMYTILTLEKKVNHKSF